LPPGTLFEEDEVEPAGADDEDDGTGLGETGGRLVQLMQKLSSPQH
jgi:hypothetical protein